MSLYRPELCNDIAREAYRDIDVSEYLQKTYVDTGYGQPVKRSDDRMSGNHDMS